MLEGTKLFPPELLPDMLKSYVNGNEEGAYWLTIEQAAKPIGFAYIAPEALTDRTFNLIAIAILPEMQGTGVGSALLKHIETVLKADKARILVIDTSGTDAFQQTCDFYIKNGYAEEARILNFDLCFSQEG